MDNPQLKAYYVYGAVFQSRQLEALLAEVEGVRLAEDMECIHRMRVASRRLRAAQSHFDGFLSDRKAKLWEKEIRLVTRALSLARDLDVQIAAINDFSLQSEDPKYKPGIRRLTLRLQQKRSKAQTKVLESLDGLESSGVLNSIAPRLKDLADEKDHLYLYTPYLYQSAFKFLSARLDEMLAYQEFIYQPDKITELHAMRISAKRLRYTMEIFSPLYPGALKQALRSVRDLQEVLGNLHDADVWLAFLPDFLERERQFSLEFYGRLRNYSVILPAIQLFNENRQKTRDEVYQQLVSCWETSLQQDVWKQLRDTLQIPFYIEHPVEIQPEPFTVTEENHENRIDQ